VLSCQLTVGVLVSECTYGVACAIALPGQVNVADDDGLATIETGPASQLAQSNWERVCVWSCVRWCGVERGVVNGGLLKLLVHQCIRIQRK
jgi:hypothetical protein